MRAAEMEKWGKEEKKGENGKNWRWQGKRVGTTVYIYRRLINQVIISELMILYYESNSKLNFIGRNKFL